MTTTEVAVNGKTWFVRLRNKVTLAVCLKTLLGLILAVTAGTTIYYRNQFSLSAVTLYLLWLVWCLSTSQGGLRPLHRAEKIVLILLTTAASLSNAVLMDIFPGIERVAVIEGINEGRSIMLKRFQPTFFLPKVYSVYYYDIDQSLETDCNGTLKTADGDDFPAIVFVPLKLINDQAIVSMMHDKMRGQERLQTVLKVIVCGAAREAVGKVGTQMRFGAKRLLTDANISGKLRYLMNMQGAQLPEDEDYLLIENMTIMPLDFKEKEQDQI